VSSAEKSKFMCVATCYYYIHIHMRDAHTCAVNRTVVATVLSGHQASLLPLAESASKVGFPCIVVLPFADPSTAPASPFIMLLPAPRPALLPRSRWCNGTGYAARRIQLYRMRLWRTLLGMDLSVLGVEASRRLLRNPLPAIAAMRTRASRVPDVLGFTPGWFAKHFYLSSTMFVRATAATRALLEAAVPRVSGADEDVIFSEELNFGAGRNATCCHTECFSRLVAPASSERRRKAATPAAAAAAATPRPPLLDHDVRNEAPPGRSRHWPNGERCRALGLEYDDAPPHAPAPPNATSNRWPRDASGSLAASGAKRYGTTAAGLPLFQLAWRPDAYNTLHVPLHRFGRCTGRTESCVGLHADCPPPPPPFDVVIASKKASSSKGSRRSRARASKPGAGPGGATTRGL
jgi:hypothetical protein